MSSDPDKNGTNSVRTYTELVNHTKNKNLIDFHQLLNAALGLAGEAGEFADLVKKHAFQGHELDRDKVVKELGDVRYYLELACITLGITITEVEETNKDKLLKRYPNGFTVEASIRRADTK